MVKLSPGVEIGPAHRQRMTTACRLIPEPKADQALPSHLAMSLAGTVPMKVKPPPTYTLPLPSAAMAYTEPSAPGMPGFKLTQSASLKVGSMRTG